MKTIQTFRINLSLKQVWSQLIKTSIKLFIFFSIVYFYNKESNHKKKTLTDFRALFLHTVIHIYTSIYQSRWYTVNILPSAFLLPFLFWAHKYLLNTNCVPTFANCQKNNDEQQ